MTTTDTNPIVIAGGGIGGLAMALTLHQIGVPFVVLEAVRELRPLGVGINLQPNAVKELFALGITRRELSEVGVPVAEWALVGRNGLDIYREPRGEDAGYHWPQYAVHRGRFHMLLRDKLLERAGATALQSDRRVVRFEQETGGVTVHLTDHAGTSSSLRGAMLIGADGIHSTVRSQMFPNDPGVQWGGALMWRGTSLIPPLSEKPAFLGLGSATERMVIYPISAPDSQTGLVEMNWIAEITLPKEADWNRERWFTPVATDSFVHHFADWRYDWLDVPALISQRETAFENPMIDRAPLPTWHQGHVALMGDAAHAMYPTGSNGASQALVDARELGASLVEHGVTPAALAAYDGKLCGPVSALQLRNRGDGPFGLLSKVDALCGGQFDDINAVMSAAERDRFMADYKAAAGFAMATLNAAPPILAEI